MGRVATETSNGARARMSLPLGAQLRLVSEEEMQPWATQVSFKQSQRDAVQTARRLHVSGLAGVAGTARSLDLLFPASLSDSVEV